MEKATYIGSGSTNGPKTFGEATYVPCSMSLALIALPCKASPPPAPGKWPAQAPANLGRPATFHFSNLAARAEARRSGASAGHGHVLGACPEAGLDVVLGDAVLSHCEEP